MTIYIIQERINDEIGGVTEWATLWATQDKLEACKNIKKLQTRDQESGEVFKWEYRIETTTLF